jgi:hypothetical protein
LADRRFTRSIVALLVVLLAACATQVAPPPQETRRPADFPEALYRQLAAQGKPVFQVDSAASHATIEVRRSGSLAQFGHDHVIASHDVAGYVAPDERRADLFVSLDTLAVDEPALRAQAGFDTQPSADDIAGTRRNMLEKVLESGQYPFVQIAIRGADAAASPPALQVSVTLHGTTRIVEPELRLETSSDSMDVTGTFAIEQSKFGIVPFSILGGAIAVQDRVIISFRLHALRVH